MRLASFVLKHLHEFVALGAVIMVHLLVARRLLGSDAVRRSLALHIAVPAAAVLLSLWATFGVLMSFPQGYRLLPSSWTVYWIRGSALAWCFASLIGGTIYWVSGRIHDFSPKRRGFLRATGSALATTPFAMMGFGILWRDDFHVREIDVPVEGLPKDLEGLRLVHLSDIHLSPFLSEKELERAVDMANETRAHLALVTGDLITSEGDPLDACIRQVARLRADAGILGCLGNHEIYARCENQATEKGARAGIDFLRQRTRALRFGNATLNVAGVDYQRSGRRYLAHADELVAPGAVNLLLSHNPNAFDDAARLGFRLVVSGHTHGGQVTVEILHQTLNVARFFTPYVYGLYRTTGSTLWVTRGIGTVGVPARLGARPEIALLRLCAT